MKGRQRDAKCAHILGKKRTPIIIANVLHVNSGAGSTKFSAALILLKTVSNAALSQKPTNYHYPTNKEVWNSLTYPGMMRPASDNGSMYRVIISTEKCEPKYSGLLLQSRDSAGKQMGPECRGELRIDYLDNRWAGGSSSPQVAVQVLQATIYNF